MIISEDELKRRLNSDKNLATKLNKKPDVVKTVGGVLSKIEPIKEVSKELNIPVKELRAAQKTPAAVVTTQRVQELALSMLMESLGLLTKSNLIDEKPKDISIIAANLSRVYNNVSPKDTSTGKVNVTVMCPTQRNISDYQVVEIHAVNE
jgi:hypothetical protein